MSGHGSVRPKGVQRQSNLMVPAARLSFQVLRSARMAAAVWYLRSLAFQALADDPG